MSVEGPERSVARKYVSERPEGSTRDPKGAANRSKTREKRAKSLRELGLEPSAPSCAGKDLQQSIAQKYKNQGKSRAPDGLDDSLVITPKLEIVVDAWPELPVAVRAGIVAMVERLHGKEPQQ